MPDPLPTTPKLTAAMERHLRELAEVGRTASWGPANAGEWRCAEALVRRGLLVRRVERGRRPFVLSPRGWEVAREL